MTGQCVSRLALSGLLLCLASVISGQTRCCWWEQWEGVAEQKLGMYDRPSDYASLASIQSKVHVDNTVQKIYTDSLVVNNSHTFHVQNLEDFKNGYSYTVVNGVCIKQKMSKSMDKNCVPDSASFLSTNNFAGILADTWLVSTPVGHNTTHTTRLTVSRNRCVPLHETLLDIAEVCRLSMITIHNVTAGIADPTVFNIPAACNRTQLSLEPSHMWIPHMTVVGTHHSIKHRIF